MQYDGIVGVAWKHLPADGTAVGCPLRALHKGAARTGGRGREQPDVAGGQAAAEGNSQLQAREDDDLQEDVYECYGRREEGSDVDQCLAGSLLAIPPILADEDASG